MTDTPEAPVVEEPVDPWDSEEGDAVRLERNVLLAESDYLVLADNPAQRTMLTRAEVWLYRKALRDITDAFESPEDVEWPDLPEVG